MSDHHSSERDEEAPKATRVDGETKMQQLTEKLNMKKQRFYLLSEEIFDVNQECLSKNDELKILKEKYTQHNKLYVRALTELALKEADLQYKREHAIQKSSVVTDFALESNQDVERLRMELKGALQQYQDSRRQAKGLQEEFSKLADSSRVESLNFLAFCRYSQSVQSNEITKLTVSELLPSKKEINTCTTQFLQCAAQSRAELTNYYKTKIHEFQREERVQMGKCKTQLENSHRNKDGHLGFGISTNNTSEGDNQSSLEHHLHVNSLENRYAQRLLAEAQLQLQGSANNSRSDSFNMHNLSDSAKAEISKLAEGYGLHNTAHSTSHSAHTTGRNSPTTTMTYTPVPPKSGKHSASASTSSNKYTKNTTTAKFSASYLAPTANTTNSSTVKYTTREAEKQALSATLPTTASHSQKSKFRAQLSQLYRSKKKAASALSEMHSAKQKGVFDAAAFRTAAAAPESPLLSNILLDAELVDSNSNNLVMDNGTYVDQGQALGELIGQLCAAEGKFRQLNAIKEGLDVQLVKQAHFLMLLGRDLHSDIATKARSSGRHASSLPPVPTTINNNSGSGSGGISTVNDSTLTRAFARPDPSAHRSVGTLTAGGAISNKYRYRVDPTAVMAAPFVPLQEIQEDYQQSEDRIRRIIAEAAAVLKVL